MRTIAKRLTSFQSMKHCYLVSPLTHSFTGRRPFLSLANLGHIYYIQLSISMLPVANP